MLTFPRGTIDIGHERVEPDDGRRFLRRRRRLEQGAVLQRVGQKPQSQVESCAGIQHLADLLVGLAFAEVWLDLDECGLGHTQAEGATNFAGEQLGDKRTPALRGCVELKHIELAVIRLDECGHRPTLPKWLEVAGRRKSTFNHDRAVAGSLSRVCSRIQRHSTTGGSLLHHHLLHRAAAQIGDIHFTGLILAERTQARLAFKQQNRCARLRRIQTPNPAAAKVAVQINAR